MNYKLRKAVVVGAGTMGAAIAAHFANAGVRVTLLDIVPKQLTEKEKKKGLTLEDRPVRNRIAQQGLDRALKSNPASFADPSYAELVTVGNLEDDLEAASDADWILEAIIENLAIKQDLMARLDELRGEHTIVSTNTSGIPVGQIAEGRSESFRRHFLGTHFFNPPRYLKLLEVIPTLDTLQEVMGFIRRVGERRLGKGIVVCKDTPNFIANRLGSVSGAFAVKTALEMGLGVKEVDSITGPVLGRPKTATFRLLDLVGIDVWNHVGTNLASAVPEDEHAQEVLNNPAVEQLLNGMLEKNMLGNKSGGGFYKMKRGEDGKTFWELNLESLEYDPPSKPRFDSVGEARGKSKLAEKVSIMLSAEDGAGEFSRQVVYQGLAYASQVIPEIADTPKPIDDAMCWGFGHDAGPFELWDALGVKETAQKMEKEGFEPAAWVHKMLEKGFDSFYIAENGKKSVYHPGEGTYIPVREDPLRIVLKNKKQEHGVILKNDSASMIDLGEGVACVEFHTKMNVLDADIGNLVEEALDCVDKDFEGLVIGNDADNFSAGANLFLVVMNAQAEQWDELEAMVKGLQDMHMRMRYFHKPVVVAPAGMTLGGGAEMMMHASRIVAHLETYTGLVELGAGVIPAGGGTKEMMRRVLNPPMRTPNANALPFMQRLFEQVGQAQVAKSAAEARSMGLLSDTDRIVMKRDHLLAEAKREVLAMADAGYVPPRPEKVYAAGRDLLAALHVAIYMYEEGGYISAYDAHLGKKLAYVMTGGDLSEAQWVSEQYILDLEREAFLSLCGEEKSQQRMWHILNTGKPLRN